MDLSRCTRMRQKFSYILNVNHSSAAVDAFAMVVKMTNHTGLSDDEFA